MAEDWRIAESRDQAMLYVVLTAVRELAPAAALPASPKPLFYSVEASLEQHVSRIKEAVSKKKTTLREDVNRELAKLIDAHAEGGPIAQELSGTKPWKCYDVVNCWVANGNAVTAWKNALNQLQKEHARLTETDPKPSSRWEAATRVVTSFLPIPKRTVSETASARERSEGASRPRLDDTIILLKLLETHMRGDGSAPLSPALWWADNAPQFDAARDRLDG